MKMIIYIHWLMVFYYPLFILSNYLNDRPDVLPKGFLKEKYRPVISPNSLIDLVCQRSKFDSVSEHFFNQLKIFFYVLYNTQSVDYEKMTTYIYNMLLSFLVSISRYIIAQHYL